MTFIPQNSLRKSIGSVRIVHNGSGAADLYIDSGTATSISFSLGNWTEIFASSASTVKAIEIFDGTGEVAIIGTGAAGSESIQFRITPGGNGLNFFQIDSSSRIALQYESNIPAAGSETVINFYK